MKLDIRSFELPFQYPFTISKGTKTHQPTLVVKLQHRDWVGYGEAPAITYYNVTTDEMTKVAEFKRRFIEQFAFTEPGRWWHYLHHLLPAQPFLVCALDMAGWDLFGKMRNLPVSAMTGLQKVDHPPATDYTIGIASIPEMIRKMEARPWPIYKIKLGTAEDIEIVKALRAHTDKPLRVDANAGWKQEEAIRIIEALVGLGVELVEQPLAKDDFEGMAWLKARSPLPLFADESCVFEADVKACAEVFHGINIKLTKCSGITPALRMIQEGRALGLKLMIGSMNESSIGSAAIAHLSPFVDYIDMDGPLLLSEDLADGLSFDENGRPKLAGHAGLGIEPYTSIFSSIS